MILSSDLNDRNDVTDLLAEADVGINSKRIVNCSANTLNTPYKDGLTNASQGTAYINMANENFGTVIYVVNSGYEIFLRKKASGVWDTNWAKLTTNADISYGNLGAGNFGAVEGRWQKFGQIITFAGLIQSISGASGAWGTLATIPHTSISQIQFRPLLNSTGNEPIVRDGNISGSNITAWLANEDNGKYIFFSGTYVCNN